MQTRCLSNILKTHKPAVLEAIKSTGEPVEWRDEPDYRMDGHNLRHLYGSIWSAKPCVSRFWTAYEAALKETESAS